MSSRKAIILTAVVTLFFTVFFLFPVIMVIGEAFVDRNGGLTLDYISEVFVNPVYLEGLWNALLLGVTSTLAALLIAFPLRFVFHPPRSHEAMSSTYLFAFQYFMRAKCVFVRACVR